MSEEPTDWKHPGDQIDEIDQARAAVESSDGNTLEVIRKLMLMCVPSRQTYGGARRFEAGWRRMVAICYRVAPELFEGMDHQSVAKMVGLEVRAFRKQLAGVDEMLKARRPAAPSPALPENGSSLASDAVAVPRDAERLS